MSKPKSEAPVTGQRRKYSAEEKARAMARHQDAIDAARATAGNTNARNMAELERRAVLDSGGPDPLPSELDDAQ